MSGRALGPFLLFLAGSCVDGGGELGSVRPLIESSSCPECTIELVEVARLGQPGDSVSLARDIAHRSCMAAELASGEWVAGGLVGGGGPAVYDATGRLARRIGRAGEGPGEYGRNVRVVSAPGALYVVDNSNLRATELALPGLREARSFRLGRRVQAVALLERGEMLLHGRASGSPGSNERRFALVNLATHDERNFGEPSEELADLDQWIVSPGRGGGFWAASGWTYELHRWTDADSVAFTLVRGDVPWFPADNEYSDAMYELEPPPSWFVHAWEAADSLLWTYSQVPDANWNAELSAPSSPAEDEEVFDMVIEVIDLRSAAVIAHMRFHTILGSVCGSPLMYAADETELGDVRLVLLEPRLTRGPD